MDPRIPPTDLSSSESAPILSFLAPAPNATYTLDERQKGSGSVEVCRTGGEGAQGRECTQIAQDVTKVFAFMQKQGFFCQLPFDPTHTEIECIRINKIVARQS
ncbi:hypothetical protein JCM10207_002975 [Rhodosporidiobolus poonsookiae]